MISLGGVDFLMRSNEVLRSIKLRVSTLEVSHLDTTYPSPSDMAQIS